jgi:hypothetical protein
VLDKKPFTSAVKLCNIPATYETLEWGLLPPKKKWQPDHNIFFLFLLLACGKVRVPKIYVVKLASELALESRVKLEKHLAGAHILDTAFVDRASRKLNSVRHKKI